MRPPIARASRFAGEVRRADELEHDVVRRVGGEVLGSHDPDADAERGNVGSQCFVADRRGDARAGEQAELHAGDADPAGCAVYEQVLAGPRARTA